MANTKLLSPVCNAQLFDNFGNMLSGGTISVYNADTTTLATIYSTSSGAAMVNPIVLDATGRIPSGQLYLDLGLRYDVLVKKGTTTLESYYSVAGVLDGVLEVSGSVVNKTIKVMTSSNTFPLGQNPEDISLVSVFLNGLALTPGVDYILSASNLITSRYLVAGDKLLVKITRSVGSEPASVFTRSKIFDTWTTTDGTLTYLLNRSPGAIENLTVSLSGVVLYPTVGYTWNPLNPLQLVLTANPGDGQELGAQYNDVLPLVSLTTTDTIVYATSGDYLTDTLDGIILDMSRVTYAAEFGAVGDGTTDDTAAIQAAIAAASSTGAQLHFSPGVYVITSSLTFTCSVRMMYGARLKVTDPSNYIKFAAGFDCDIHYCLDTDGATQFLNIEKIYPQWFGPCGDGVADDSVTLTRAFKACRASFSHLSHLTSTAFGCRTVYFPSGTYRCKNVPLYSATNIVGEMSGSAYGARIVQIKYDAPAVVVMPVNIGLDGTVINTGVGQNFIRDIGIHTELAASTINGEPQFRFYSPAQAYSYLSLSGTPGTVGHIDTMFLNCWFKDGDCATYCNEGAFWVHLRDCTSDVCFTTVWHDGTSSGQVRSYNNILYWNTRGAYRNTSSDTVRWDLNGDEIKAGNCYEANADWRHALFYNPVTLQDGSFVTIKNCNLLRSNAGGYNNLAANGVSTTFTNTTGSDAFTVYVKSDSVVTKKTIITDYTYNTTTKVITFLSAPSGRVIIQASSIARVGGNLFINKCESVAITKLFMRDPDSANDQKAIAIQNCNNVVIDAVIHSEIINAPTGNAALLQFFEATTGTFKSIKVDVEFVYKNASPLPFAIAGLGGTYTASFSNCRFIGNFSAKTGGIVKYTLPVATITAASTISFVQGQNTFIVSGTTPIDTISTAGFGGERVTLIFNGVSTVNDATGNLQLAGNFAATANDTLQVVCDGTNWYEVCRSEN